MRLGGLRSHGVMLALLLAPDPAHAGGVWLWETGSATDIGLAGAHWGAGSDDASVAWTNPAAMTLLEHSEAHVQLTPSFGVLRFDPNSSTTNTGSSGGKTGFGPVFGGAFVWAATPKLRLGIASSGLGGGSLDYGSDWVGRYRVTKLNFTALALAPGFAYRIRDWLSAGASVDVGFARIDYKANLNNTVPGQPDGKLEYQDHDFGVGGTLALLFQPLDGTRIAVTYRTPLKFHLSDRPSFHNVLPPLSTAIDAAGLRNAELEIPIEFPMQALIGLQQRLVEGLDLVANVDWEDWSEFGGVEISLQDPAATSVSVTIPSQDTWHVAVGLRWRPQPKWLLTTGFGWDSSMFTTSHRSPVFPIDRQFRVGAGVQYELRDDLSLGFSYEYLNAGRAPIQSTGGPLSGPLFGHYDINEVHFFTVSVNWRP